MEEAAIASQQANWNGVLCSSVIENQKIHLEA